MSAPSEANGLAEHLHGIDRVTAASAVGDRYDLAQPVAVIDVPIRAVVAADDLNDRPRCGL